jgi:hypothetical protein
MVIVAGILAPTRAFPRKSSFVHYSSAVEGGADARPSYRRETRRNLCTGGGPLVLCQRMITSGNRSQGLSRELGSILSVGPGVGWVSQDVALTKLARRLDEGRLSAAGLIHLHRLSVKDEMPELKSALLPVWRARALSRLRVACAAGTRL